MSTASYSDLASCCYVWKALFLLQRTTINHAMQARAVYVLRISRKINNLSDGNCGDSYRTSDPVDPACVRSSTHSHRTYMLESLRRGADVRETRVDILSKSERSERGLTHHATHPACERFPADDRVGCLIREHGLPDRDEDYIGSSSRKYCNGQVDHDRHQQVIKSPFSVCSLLAR